MAERLTPRTLDLEVQGSSLARRVVSLKELYSTLSLFTQVIKWVPAWRRYLWFPRQMTSRKLVQKFHAGDASLPRYG